jgi:transposase InsO family protein
MKTSVSTAHARVWQQLKREGFAVARCTVERLMRSMGLQGVIRGKRVRTTVADKATPCPRDHVNRQFQVSRPNVLWVSDFTFVATWQGFVYGLRHRCPPAEAEPATMPARRS